MDKEYNNAEHEWHEQEGVATGTVYYDEGSSVEFKTVFEPGTEAFREEMNEAVNQARARNGFSEDQIYNNHSKMASSHEPGDGEILHESYVEMPTDKSKQEEETMKSGDRDMNADENLRDPSSWDI